MHLPKKTPRSTMTSGHLTYYNAMLFEILLRITELLLCPEQKRLYLSSWMPALCHQVRLLLS